MTTFKEMDLRPEIIKAVSELGFETPTPIQAETIPILLSGNKDMIGLAQTGTGKTAAFGLPLIHNTKVTKSYTQSLILSPTRELCIQIHKDLTNYSKYIDGFKVVAIYGGAGIDKQIKQLKKGQHIVVGTPGRVIDLIKRGHLKLEKITNLVLDEADEMLNMGFKEDLNIILKTTPDEKQTLLFSATMPSGIASITKNYLHDPEKITVGTKNTGADNVEHHFYMVNARDRYKALKRLADVNPNIYGIVFCRTRAETKDIADKLMQDGYNADALHGDLSQAQRDFVMSRFRAKHLQILVATDVAARGLDVNDLSHIINYNLPDDPEVYVHRSGRTGRAGKSGISIAIIHTREKGKLKQVEKNLKKKFIQKQVPNGEEICEVRLYSLIDKVRATVVNHEQINPFLPVVYEKLETLSREDLIKHFLSVEFNRYLSYYNNAPDLNARQGTEREPREKKKRGDVKFSRFYINLGTKNKINPASVIGLINQNLDKRGVEIGKIELMKKFSFFEIDSRFEKDIISGFRNKKYQGQDIIVEVSKGQVKPEQKRSRSNRNRKKW